MEPRLMVYFRLQSGVVLNRVFGPPALVKRALSRDHDSVHPNKIICDRSVPHGATHWRTLVTEPWRPIEEFRA